MNKQFDPYIILTFHCILCCIIRFSLGTPTLKSDNGFLYDLSDLLKKDR